VFLLRWEWRRYKADRAPAPPPSPEEAALDRWNAGVVMLVAGLSIVGALLAWWASSEFSLASSLSQQAVQEATQYQTVKAEQNGYVAFGARLSEAYGEHTVAESNLYQQAAAAWAAGQGSAALQLEAEARVEGAQARALDPGFVCYWPTYPGTNGGVQYDVQALQATEQENPCEQPDQDTTALRTLDQSHVEALGSTSKGDRTRAEEVVLAGALVIVAVFFLTLSYLGWRHRRAHALTPGVVAVAAALAIAVVAAF
jgi:hypothetical protein